MSKHPIIIALDVSRAEEADALLAHFAPVDKPWIKIGYQLFYAVGPRWVAAKKEAGYSIFLDLKLHDIPNTVGWAIRSLLPLGIDMLTLHASGGKEMIAAARREVDQSTDAQRMKLLAVTQLTSTDQTMLNDELQIQGSVESSVQHLAQLSNQAGADGVICSGYEVQRVKQTVRNNFLAVTPGIRPAGNQAQDQKRVVTPQKAIEWGTDYLVIGRPITKAASPLEAYEKVVQEVTQAKERLKA